MKEVLLKVPLVRHEEQDNEESFIDKLKKFAYNGISICLDFQNVICISSMALGSIIWTAKHCGGVSIRFVNVHHQLYPRFCIRKRKKVEQQFV